MSHTEVHRLKFPDVAIYQATLTPAQDFSGATVLLPPAGLTVVELGPITHTAEVAGELVITSITPGHHVDVLGELPEAWEPYLLNPQPTTPVHGFAGIHE